jgi:hypothetical protein
MKTTLFLSALLFSVIAGAQNPYQSLNNEFRHLFDPIPIDKGQEQQFYEYAIKLFQQDSLQKAGQIFDRVYWLDSSSLLAKQALVYRSKIEQVVIEKIKANLTGIWNWDWTGTAWGVTDSPERSKVIKRMELDDSTIRFYRNDTLMRVTKYSLVQSFRWVNGYVEKLVQYQDTKEEWAYNLVSMDSFTSNYLWLVKVTKVGGSHPLGESYSLENEKQQLTTACMQ